MSNVPEPDKMPCTEPRAPEGPPKRRETAKELPLPVAKAPPKRPPAKRPPKKLPPNTKQVQAPPAGTTQKASQTTSKATICKSASKMPQCSAEAAAGAAAPMVLSQPKILAVKPPPPPPTLEQRNWQQELQMFKNAFDLLETRSVEKVEELEEANKVNDGLKSEMRMYKNAFQLLKAQHAELEQTHQLQIQELLQLQLQLKQKIQETSESWAQWISANQNQQEHQELLAMHQKKKETATIALDLFCTRFVLHQEELEEKNKASADTLSF
eukprot:s125_g41.t1